MSHRSSFWSSRHSPICRQGSAWALSISSFLSAVEEQLLVQISSLPHQSPLEHASSMLTVASSRSWPGLLGDHLRSQRSWSWMKSSARWTLSQSLGFLTQADWGVAREFPSLRWPDHSGDSFLSGWSQSHLGWRYTLHPRSLGSAHKAKTQRPTEWSMWGSSQVSIWWSSEAAGEICFWWRHKYRFRVRRVFWLSDQVVGSLVRASWRRVHRQTLWSPCPCPGSKGSTVWDKLG